MTDHTPTPWYISGGSDFRGSDMQLVGMVNPTTKQGKIDRAFIVKAVNAHEAYEELDRASAYYISRLEIMVRGGTVRDLGEAESWYTTALDSLTRCTVTSADRATVGGE